MFWSFYRSHGGDEALRLLSDGINEVILTTVSSDGRPNASPMGIILREGKARLRVYRGSHTLSNILEVPYAVAHITYDPLLFVICSLSDPGEWAGWKTVEGINLPLLGADARLYLRCSEKSSSSSCVVFDVEVIEDEVLGSPKAYNRGFSVLVEACILATRYRVFRDESIRERIMD
ncbi:hypothetical protein DRN72_02175 [Methanosarcinales archaeon]|nr:MAG: hypothetical protein DRN72_02175 [Methanosarcinales archaeon]